MEKIFEYIFLTFRKGSQMHVILSLNGPNNILPPQATTRDYLLAFSNNTLFENVLEPLASTLGLADTLHLLLGEVDWNYRNWILKTALKSCPNVDLTLLKNCNNEIQSIHAFVSKSAIHDDEKCIIAPKDTVIGVELYQALINSKFDHVALGVFEGNDPKYGYILHTDDRTVVSSTQNISETAFAGVYCFAKFSELKGMLKGNKENGRLLLDILDKYFIGSQLKTIKTEQSNVTPINDITDYIGALNGV